MTIETRQRGVQRRAWVRDNHADRFWRHVDTTGSDDCWLWTGGQRKYGYGVFRWTSGLTGLVHQKFAHRVAYMLANDTALPHGVLIRHVCDTRLCCNPAHLEGGTRLDNMRDMAKRGRHGNAKLSSRIVQDMRTRHASGETQRALALEYGVCPTVAGAAINRRTWKHVE